MRGIRLASRRATRMWSTMANNAFSKVSHEGATTQRVKSVFRDIAGETLVEALISVLIISAVSLMLCTAVVTAAKVNTAIDPGDVIFNSEDAKQLSNANDDVSIVIKSDSEAGDQAEQVERKSKGMTMNGYVYYDLDD